MSIKFKGRDTLGSGTVIEVLKGRIIVGIIRKNQALNIYQYYEGPFNITNPSMQDENLEELKERLESFL